jgi:hypothetical protein
MQRIKTFLVVCFSILIISPVCAQVYPPGNGDLRFRPLKLDGNSINPIPMNPALTPVNFTGNYPGGTVPLFHPANQPPSIVVFQALSTQVLENDYYTQHFGFFCKKELQFEKVTHIPLRFRLGSLEYCNQLEHGKTSP